LLSLIPLNKYYDNQGIARLFQTVSTPQRDMPDSNGTCEYDLESDDCEATTYGYRSKCFSSGFWEEFIPTKYLNTTTRINQ